MNAKELAEKIVQLVFDLRGSVTHGTMCSYLGDVCRGDHTLEISGKNIVLMVGCSEVLCDALQMLKDEDPKRIELRPIEWMCLLVDGAPIPAKMPLAKRPPPQGYKKPHFAPCCFHPATKTSTHKIPAGGLKSHFPKCIECGELCMYIEGVPHPEVAICSNCADAELERRNNA